MRLMSRGVVMVCTAMFAGVALAAGAVPALARGSFPAAPAIVSASVSHVSQTAATLKARIKPDQLETTYELWIAVPCPAPQECIDDVLLAHGSIPAGTHVAAVEASTGAVLGVSGLQPATTYEYWVLASNTDGTGELRKTFRTRRG